MMERFPKHAWCDCLECDQSIEALRVLLVGRGNRDNKLMLALIHYTYSGDTTYHIFGELYYLLSRRGEIQDRQLVDEDEDDDDEDWDPDDGV